MWKELTERGEVPVRTEGPNLRSPTRTFDGLLNHRVLWLEKEARVSPLSMGSRDTVTNVYMGI